MPEEIRIRTGAHSIAELFYYSVTTVLFQRNVYPRGEFRRVQKWGMPVMDTTNTDLVAYLRSAIKQIKKWTTTNSLQDFALLILDLNNELVERWHFGVEVVRCSDEISSQNDIDELRKSFQVIMRQITTTITVLPLLRGPHTFRLVAETGASESDVWVPQTARKAIEDPQLLTFTHIDVGKQKLGGEVEYRIK